MKKLTLFLLSALISTSGLFAITKTVGTTGADYATLGAAFTDINDAANGMTGTIELQIIADVEQAGPAIISRDGVVVLIYPTVTGKTISMAGVAGATIQINGADNITIDGRLRDSSGNIVGSTPDLTITNTYTAAAAVTNCAIYFIKGTTIPTNNTITYCNIKGSNDVVVYVNPNNATTPTATNNVISYNKFSPAVISPSVVRPKYVINTVKGVHSDKYTYNNFENVVKTEGIRLQDQAVNCEISYNSFYETASFNPGSHVIYINAVGSGAPRTGNVIKNNYIGGSAPLCAGTMTKSDGSSYSFTGISVSASSDATIIKNNTIKNIAWTNNGDVAFLGISVYPNANLVTTIDGNYISDIDYSRINNNYNYLRNQKRR